MSEMSKFNYRNHNFPNAVSMAKYILQCDRQDKIEEEKENQKKLEFEKEQRIKELNSAYKEYIDVCNKAKAKYNTLYKKYRDDYSSTPKTKNTSYDIISLDELVESMFS